MKHQQCRTEGTTIVLTKPASWTNYKCPTVTMPAGTKLTLISWRPEGWNCKTEDGKYFFVFHSDMPPIK